MVRKQTLVDRLRDIPIFRSLTLAQCKSLAASAALRGIQAREALYEQGQAASSCFVVLAGTIQFTVLLGTQRVIAGLVTVSEMFGLEALRDREIRPETATAACASELLEVNGKFLKGMLLDNPRFQFELLKMLIAQTQERSAHAVRTGHYDAEQRIAAYLIDHFPDKDSGDRHSVTAPSQADLADYLGLTPETFCRKLGKFRRLGWVGGSGNDYVVKRQDSLRRLLER